MFAFIASDFDICSMWEGNTRRYNRRMNTRTKSPVRPSLKRLGSLLVAPTRERERFGRSSNRGQSTDRICRRSCRMIDRN